MYNYIIYTVTFLVMVLRPFQDYFTYFKNIIHQVGENWSTQRKTTWASIAEINVWHRTLSEAQTQYMVL